MSNDLSKVFERKTLIIPPSRITTGTFTCTTNWGFNDEGIFREVDFTDLKSKQFQRGALFFNKNISKFVKDGEYQPWNPENAVLSGPTLACAFSLCDFHVPTEEIRSDGDKACKVLPCALVHSFETMNYWA